MLHLPRWPTVREPAAGKRRSFTCRALHRRGPALEDPAVEAVVLALPAHASDGTGFEGFKRGRQS